MLACQEFLLEFGQSVRLFLILQVPDRYLILQWLIDAQEEIDHVLAIWVAEVIG